MTAFAVAIIVNVGIITSSPLVMPSVSSARCRAVVTFEQDIPYLPLDAQFGSTTAQVTFPVDGHWNVEGHRVAACAIDTFLLKLGVFNVAEPEESRR